MILHVVETSDHMRVSISTATYCVNFGITYIDRDKRIEDEATHALGRWD
jgi:hypothetical protein